MNLQGHFPWQRLVMCLMADALILHLCWVYKGWLYFFAVMDPAHTSGATAITALSAVFGVAVMGVVALQIFFVTGSTRSLEAMFRFSAASVAQNIVQSNDQHITQEIVERTPRPRDFEEQEDDIKPI